MRKVLISAYSCIPGRGSEPGAGWSIAEGAAERNEVWLLTKADQQCEIDAYLAAHPQLQERIHPVYVSTPPALDRASMRRGDFYWHYPLWQYLAGRQARQLHQQIGFDVMHHATFAADWQYVGLTQVNDVPLVWGPVGGATYPSLLMISQWLTPKETAYEAMRSVTTRAFRRAFADRAARRAQVVVAMNHDTERRFANAQRVVVEGNACIERPTTKFEAAHSVLNLGQTSARHAVFVGMLYGWKGMSLAVRALAKPGAEDWDLTIIGDGPELERLRDLTAELRLEQRVFFAGRLSRDEVYAAYCQADAMVFPSFHDSLSWAVAEAVTFGCPVVCLDLGGPPVAMGEGGIAVPATGDIPAGIASALARTTGRIAPSDRFSPDRLPDLLDSWYDAALAPTK